jgi:hypothetical protein
MEAWQAIPSAPAYEASRDGRVRNASGHVLTPVDNGSGYMRVRLCGPRRLAYVHRLVAETFVGPILDGLQVNHLNGIRADNHAANLEVVTQSENALHAYRTGLWTRKGDAHWTRRRPDLRRRGEAVSSAKLTSAAVLEARRLRCLGWTLRKLGAHFGVTPTTINNAVIGKTWSHV